MSITRQITKKWPSVTKNSVTTIFPTQRENSGTTVRYVSRGDSLRRRNSSSKSLLLSERPHWIDREYREAYMEAAVEQGIAWQIQINRKFRSMSQKDLASAIGTQQSSISRFEDPEYGAHSLEILKVIAKAFDCALHVGFIPYSELARRSNQLSETDQYAAPFSLDVEQSNE
jgi:transcriptional regulator with XRE-family HTH domain